MTAAAVAPSEPLAAGAPKLRRRLACFVYEGVLLFGVVATAGLAYALVTQQRHALVGSRGLQVWLFIIIGAYFVWFWSRHGQTLAMRTWHIRVVTRQGSTLRPGRALMRYLLSWVWFLPALLTLHLAGLNAAVPVTFVLGAGVLGYVALTWLHPSRQYWHDIVCGTRLVEARTDDGSRP